MCHRCLNHNFLLGVYKKKQKQTFASCSLTTTPAPMFDLYQHNRRFCIFRASPFRSSVKVTFC
nr:B106 [uncultured bacterium]ART38342.1 G212 [uncultured bacterium]